MKKLFLATLIGLTVMLSACGNSTKVIEGEVKTATEDKATEKDEAQVKEEATTQEENGSAAHKGYTFTYQDVVIEIDAEAAPITEKLGEPNSYFEAPSCAFEGIDKMYTYNSFEVDTYPSKTQDYISTIIFKDDVITTTEGVGIGDPVDKVMEVYGEDGSNEDGMLVFEKDGMKLCFIIQDDTVASVEYRSTVLDE